MSQGFSRRVSLSIHLENIHQAGTTCWLLCLCLRIMQDTGPVLGVGEGEEPHVGSHAVLS